MSKFYPGTEDPTRLKWKLSLVETYLFIIAHCVLRVFEQKYHRCVGDIVPFR